MIAAKPQRELEAPLATDFRTRWHFLLRFAAALVILYFLFAIHPVNDRVVVPFTRGIVTVSAGILRLIGEPVTAEGTIIRSSAFSVDVQNGCNGLEAISAAAEEARRVRARCRSAGGSRCD